ANMHFANFSLVECIPRASHDFSNSLSSAAKASNSIGFRLYIVAVTASVSQHAFSIKAVGHLKCKKSCAHSLRTSRRDSSASHVLVCNRLRTRDILMRTENVPRGANGLESKKSTSFFGAFTKRARRRDFRQASKYETPTNTHPRSD